AGDLAHASERLEKARSQRRLVPLDAAEDAAQPLAGDENEDIAGSRCEGAREGEHRRRIGGVADGYQRAAHLARATPLEHRGEHLELTRFRHRDGAAGEWLRIHTPAS